LNIQRGATAQSAAIAKLIYASEPRLLSFLFGNDTRAQAYLQQACSQTHGQFSANYHWVSLEDGKTVDGICATWLSVMPVEFQLGTIASLREFLTPEQIIHLLAYKETLDACFIAPQSHQVCLGHVSVCAASQQKGIASALIAHAVEYAIKSAKREIILDVEEANLGAIKCYLKAGFVELKHSRFEPTQQTFVRMTLRI
jgi:ribosomal protein S18 acetylase RimI-like enzyme